MLHPTLGCHGHRQSGHPHRPHHLHFTATLDAAVCGAELAIGDGEGRVYLVEPTGPYENDPNLTDKRFAGNPTRSYRTQQPIRVVGEVTEAAA